MLAKSQVRLQHQHLSLSLVTDDTFKSIVTFLFFVIWQLRIQPEAKIEFPTHLLEDISAATDLTQQMVVGDGQVLLW